MGYSHVSLWGRYLAEEVAGHSPADQLPIEKTREAPV